MEKEITITATVTIEDDTPEIPSLRFVGRWNINSGYDPNDVVYHNDAEYVCTHKVRAGARESHLPPPVSPCFHLLSREAMSPRINTLVDFFAIFNICIFNPDGTHRDVMDCFNELFEHWDSPYRAVDTALIGKMGRQVDDNAALVFGLLNKYVMPEINHLCGHRFAEPLPGTLSQYRGQIIHVIDATRVQQQTPEL